MINIYFISSLVQSFSSMLVFFCVFNSFSDEQVSIYILYSAYSIIIFQLFSFGLPSVFEREFVRNVKLRSYILSSFTIFYIYLILFLLSFFLIFLFLNYIDTIFLCFIFFIFLSTLSEILLIYLRINENKRIYLYQTLIYVFLTFSLISYLYIKTLLFERFIFFIFLISLFRFLFIFFHLNVRFHYFKKKLIIRMLNKSILLYPKIIPSLLITQFDKIFVGAVFSEQVLNSYAFVQRVFNLSTILSNAFDKIYKPSLLNFSGRNFYNLHKTYFHLILLFLLIIFFTLYSFKATYSNLSEVFILQLCFFQFIYQTNLYVSKIEGIVAVSNSLYKNITISSFIAFFIYSLSLLFNNDIFMFMFILNFSLFCSNIYLHYSIKTIKNKSIIFSCFSFIFIYLINLGTIYVFF